MSTWRTLSILTLTGALALATACSKEEASQDWRQRAERAVKIVAEPVTFERDVLRVEAVGTARARQTAVVFPETAGVVTGIGFQPDNKVKSNAVLARLEDDAERLAVSRAEIAVKDAEQLLARYQRIDVPGAISESQIDEARTALAAAQIELDLAQLALSRRVIRAPFAGHVGISDIDPGARITTTTEITRIDDRSTVFVDFDASEEVFGQIKIGDELPLIPFSGNQETFLGKIIAIDSRLDATRRSFTVRAEIDNSDDKLRPGMSFRVEINLPGKNYPSVPEEAIVWGGDGAYIWVVREGIAERNPVTLVSREAGNELVEARLNEGDLIVAEGVDKVRDGVEVDFDASFDRRSLTASSSTGSGGGSGAASGAN